MRRELLCVVATVIVCLNVAAGMAAAASGSPSPHVRLTTVEYARLSRAQNALKRTLAAKTTDWSRARQACVTVTTATPLLASQQNACFQTVAFLRALADFPANLVGCGQTMPHKAVCILGLYRALARTATAAYRTSLTVYQGSVARGFGGECLAVLAGTKQMLHQSQQLAAATGTLARDMATTEAVAEGKLPASAVHRSQDVDDAAAFQRDVVLVLYSTAPDNLAVCPRA
jgi:hypothetical protein